ncbi:MAG: hypothetical protein WA652_19610 [Xanthobacteraceae bacterium]
MALDEGKGNNEYARALGIHRRVLSRYFRDIGRRFRNGGPGLGLVTVKPRPGYSQRIQVFLTEKGRTLATRVFRQLVGLSDIERDFVKK